MRLSAQAGELVLMLSLESASQNDESSSEQRVDRKEAMSIANACHALGGSLEAVGQIIEALISPEILRSK